MTHPSESDVRPATILVDVQLQKTPADEHGASLQELRQLIETLGWNIVGTLTQKLRSPTAAWSTPDRYATSNAPNVPKVRNCSKPPLSR